MHKVAQSMSAPFISRHTSRGSELTCDLSAFFAQHGSDTEMTKSIASFHVAM